MLGNKTCLYGVGGTGESFFFCFFWKQSAIATKEGALKFMSD